MKTALTSTYFFALLAIALIGCGQESESDSKSKTNQAEKDSTNTEVEAFVQERSGIVLIGGHQLDDHIDTIYADTKDIIEQTFGEHTVTCELSPVTDSMLLIKAYDVWVTDFGVVYYNDFLHYLTEEGFEEVTGGVVPSTLAEFVKQNKLDHKVQLFKSGDKYILTETVGHERKEQFEKELHKQFSYQEIKDDEKLHEFHEAIEHNEEILHHYSVIPKDWIGWYVELNYSK